jgi:hypothetical protein
VSRFNADDQDMREAIVPGTRSDGLGSGETFLKGLNVGPHGGRSHVSAVIEDRTLASCMSRFNPAFQELAI